ncbi:MAG: VOC family protein [Gammaproteobacteria bacterium]|nr:VOC family protein [Gammaproteobacteria bacterium]
MENHSIFIALHHGSLIVKDLTRSLNFYCHIIGLEQNCDRPNMSFDGAWLNVGEQQIHLLKLPETEKHLKLPEHAGRDRHLALHVTEIDSIKSKLKANQIPFTVSQSGRQALFCRDPDDNGLEFIKVSIS